MGNFAVKRTEGKFNKVPTDQCIEQTINRQQKSRGGIIGYATNPSTVQRWVLTSHVASKCYSELEERLGIGQRLNKPKDFGKSRSKFDDKCALRAYEVLINWGSPFKLRESLVNVASGQEALPQVALDIASAESIGETCFEEFVKCRLKSNKINFYDPIKRNKLKTFKHMSLKKTITLKEKSITISAERSLFARLLVISNGREGLSLKTVLSYSLSPIPWCFGLPDGGLVKTTKSKLLGKPKSFATF